MIDISFKNPWGSCSELFYENNKGELHRDDGFAYFKTGRRPFYYQKEHICSSFSLQEKYSVGFLKFKRDII